MKILTIFDDATRKETTGVYVRVALKENGHDVWHLNPKKPGSISNFDLYFMIDDGLPFPIKSRNKNLIFWAIDTHINLKGIVDKALSSDYVFAAQKDGARILEGKIGRSVTWLPLACDASLHLPSAKADKKYDVCFIGNTIPEMMDVRIERIDALFKKFPNFFYGRRFFNDAANKYSESKVVLNVSIKNDLNMRVFEVMASGSLLLTDALEDIKEIGLDKGCIMFNGEKDMLEKAEYYVSHDVEREEIAAKGQSLVLEAHTYKHRMETVFASLGK